MNCSAIDNLADEVMAVYGNTVLDGYDNGVISTISDLNADHWVSLSVACDTNDDSYITGCEVWECIYATELLWVAANCPADYVLYCENSVGIDCRPCPDVKSC
jgi:hypothetical protein